MNSEQRKATVFDVVNPKDYHKFLARTWIHISKDNLIRKDDEEAFVEIANMAYAYVIRNQSLPDYSEVLGWIPQIMEE